MTDLYAQKQAGDIKVTKLDLTSYDKSRKVSLLPQFVSMVISEDIFSPIIYGYIIINDPINLVDKFPIIGEEFLQIEYYVPYRGSNFARSLKFFVHALNDYSIATPGRSASYILKFSSEESLRNARTTVSMTMRNMPISEMIKTFITSSTWLNSKKDVDIIETKSNLTFTFPKSNIFDVINFLRVRIYTGEETNETYLFFEKPNQKKGSTFCLKSVNNLIQDSNNYYSNLISANITNKIYFTNFTDYDPVKDLDLYNRNIIQTNQPFLYDTLNSLKLGLYTSNVYVYDFATSRFDAFNYRFSNTFEKFVKLDTTGSKRNTDKFIEDNTVDEARQFILPVDTITPDNYIPVDKFMGPRTSYNDAIAKAAMTCDIYGDPVIRVGDIVELMIGDVTGETKQNIQRYRSGNYLVGKINHNITNGNYVMNLNLYKDFFKNKLQANNDFSIAVSS